MSNYNFLKASVCLCLIALALSCSKKDENLDEDIVDISTAGFDLSKDKLFSFVAESAFPDERLYFETEGDQETSLDVVSYSFSLNNSVSCKGESYQTTLLNIVYENELIDIIIPVNLSTTLAENNETHECEPGYIVSTGLKAAPGAQEHRFLFNSLFDLSRITTLRTSDGGQQTPIAFDPGYSFDETLSLNGNEYSEVYMKERASSGPHSMIAWSPRVGIVAFADRTGTRWYRKL